MTKFLQARKRPGKQKKRRTWLSQKRRDSFSSAEKVTDQTETEPLWYLTCIHSLWLRLPSIRCIVSSIVEAFTCLCWWSQNYGKKPLLFVKSLIAPPVSYHLEQRTLKRRLHKLEVEFLKLQLTLQTKDTNSSLSGNVCCCSCQQAKTLPSMKDCKVETAEAPLLPSVPPPPLPPPPPPPPPVPPPSFPLKRPLPLLKKVVSTRPPKAPPVKQEGPIQVTLKDLLNVKLRKTKDNIDKQTKTLISRQSFPLVSISELQGVKLKLASNMPPKRLTNVFIEKLKSPLDVRQRLRKVNLERSPGGTPLYDRENKENGTGLTPLMTKALRRKFQLAHPKSPSPLRRSPVTQGPDHVC